MLRICCCVFLLAFWAMPLGFAQQTVMTSGNAVVPLMVSFNGMLSDEHGKSSTGVVGVTFSLYKDPEGGPPLWLETQNVRPDKVGHYSVILGSVTSQGLPTTVFAKGEARWLGVQVQGQKEQPRVLLLAVPYALKAQDAETVGGKPASAFALRSDALTTPSGSDKVTKDRSSSTAKSPPVSGGGKPGFIPEWTTSTKLGDSALFQTSAGNLGISTTTPSDKFEVDLGNILVRGPHNFTSGGDTAFLYVGDPNHPIEAIRSNPKTNSGGLTIGTFKAPQGIYLQDVTGNVGIGIGTTAPAARLHVEGTSSPAIYGVFAKASQIGSSFQPTSGLWGDTGQIADLAVVGTADDGFSLVGVNNSPSGNAGLAIEGFDSTNSSGLLVDAYSAGFGGECTIDVNGNLSCTGTITPTVSIDGGKRRVGLSSIGAAEEWFEDAGSGQLSGGSAVVLLEPTFAQTVNSEFQYHVFLTPKGDCEGLYVSNETSRGFEVHELHHGYSNIAFDYRIMAKRRGREQVRLADRTRELEAPKLKRPISLVSR